METIVITAETFLKDEVEHLEGLFEAGLQRLHIRKPLADLDTVKRFITVINSAFHNRIIVHKHLELMDHFNLAGVHVNTIHFKSLRMPFGIVSTSIHAQAELEELDRQEGQLFISPVYDSISKRGYLGNRELLSLGKHPRKGTLVALGGINDQNIQKVKEHGFDGAALLGYIWESDSPLKRFLHIKNLIN
jgi:thiamine-phosphate pyrophosphorylase